MGVVWLVCTIAGIQIIVVFVAFTMFSFLPKPERSAEQLLAADLPYCWLYPSNKPSIASWFSCALTVFYSPA